MNANPNDEAVYAVNQFTDRTDEEFNNLLGLKNMPINEPNVQVISTIDENRLTGPDHRGKCNGVKDQGSCGSCWAFAANGVHECAHNMAGRGLPRLSEQDLVDCSRAYSNQGCNGGWYYWAWNYVKDKGLANEGDYAYNGRDNSCRSVNRPNRISGYAKIANNNAAVESAINARPVAIAVDASNWSSYSSGIFSNCAANINHAVVAVGYESGSHWVIRNSWGTRWGESGYMRLKHGNTCGALGYVYTLNL